ncbi:MAG TPA: divergent polysaccharide deacetylase family protein [Alphaproteobacteria bacterium]|nr:divergent polysaccharide deacetylase family protein [Alphaproteobacteria bacterium]HNS44672.1 divergent polysaccharide deacetylase family protein [Alphaproteobacteria bacterium]
MGGKLAEKFSGLGGAVKFAVSSLDPKSFTASFALLLVLSGFGSYQIISAAPVIEAEPYPALGLNTGKVLAQLDLAQHQDEPIHYGDPVHEEPSPHGQAQAENHGEDMTPMPLHTEEGGKLPVPALKETEAIEGLFEDTPFGPVPIKRVSDGMTVFDAYKMPFIPDVGAKGVIAIVMTDYGLSEGATAQSLENLPKGVSFAASPYSSDIQKKIDQARSYGHEIWMQTPIQSTAFGSEDDTGPLTMLSGLNSEQNNIRLLRTLSMARGYVGVVFNNAPNFKESPDELKDIISVLSARGLALTEAGPEDHSIVTLVDEKKLPFAASSMELDGSEGEKELRRSLEQLEGIAGKNFLAVAYIRPQPKIFSILKEWESSLSGKGLQLAPLSVIIEKSKM